MSRSSNPAAVIASASPTFATVMPWRRGRAGAPRSGGSCGSSSADRCATPSEDRVAAIRVRFPRGGRRPPGRPGYPGRRCVQALVALLEVAGRGERDGRRDPGQLSDRDRLVIAVVGAGVGSVADRGDAGLLHEVHRVGRHARAGQRKVVPGEIAMGFEHRVHDRLIRIDLEAVGDPHHVDRDVRARLGRDARDERAQLGVDLLGGRAHRVTSRASHHRVHRERVDVVARLELPDVQRRRRVGRCRGRETVAELGERVVQQSADIDDVDRAGRCHDLVQRRSLAVHRDRPEREAETTDGSSRPPPSSAVITASPWMPRAISSCSGSLPPLSCIRAG